MSAVPKPVGEPKWDIIAAKDIEAVWPYVEKGIASALETANGEATVEDMKSGLMAGRTQLAILNQNGGVIGIVFMMLSFPRFKIARVLSAFGVGIVGMREVIAHAEQWAKEQGCNYVEAWVATESRERLFSRLGYQPTYTIIRKALT